MQGLRSKQIKLYIKINYFYPECATKIMVWPRKSSKSHFWLRRVKLNQLMSAMSKFFNFNNWVNKAFTCFL